MSSHPTLQNNAHTSATLSYAEQPSGRNRHTRMRRTLEAYAQAMALSFCGTMATSALAANCTWNPATGN